MKKMCKQLISLFFCVFVAIHVSAQDVEKPFHYETSVFIIHFTENNQVFNGRANDEYHPQQMFSMIYDIVIRYVYRMTPFNQDDLSFNINDFAIWHEMVFINNVRGQRLLLGDHVLTDGSGWVQIADEDYEKLRSIIVEIREDAEYPLTDNKDKLVADWVSGLSQESDIQDYDDHFRSMEKYPGDYSAAARESQASASSSVELINPEPIVGDKELLDSPKASGADSLVKSLEAAEETHIENGQSSGARGEKIAIELQQDKLKNPVESTFSETSLPTKDGYFTAGWWFLAALGVGFVWYFWRRK